MVIKEVNDMGLVSFINDRIHTNCKKSKDSSIPKTPYKDGKYHVTIHAVERMNERKITKGAVHVNLHTKPLKVTQVKYDIKGRPSYERYSKNKVCTGINPKNQNVTTVREFASKKLSKFKKERR